MGAMTGLELLTTAEMAEADRLAVVAGVPSLTLMENAGRAVADVAWQRLKRGDTVLVLCGPGNNGGDGFVAARLLKERGCEVTVALLGARDGLKGDAAVMAALWDGPIEHSFASPAGDFALIIDALFGAGLSRDLDGVAAELVHAINAAGSRGVPVVAVDVPSGLDGTSGLAGGHVVQATETVTLFRRKPGHLLMPGRALCGAVTVADIGIPDPVLGAVDPRASANAPALWLSRVPHPNLDGHKYTRGHAVVMSGPAHATGAARMAARAALRIGAGLVTVASPTSALPENAAHLTAIMLKPCPSDKAFAEILSDARKNAVLIGPGAGVDNPNDKGPNLLRLMEDSTNGKVINALLGSSAAVVLDADALSSFATHSDVDQSGQTFGFGFVPMGNTPGQPPHRAKLLFDAIRARSERSVVLTPHEGEFKRLFPDLADSPSKLDRARKAADMSGAVVILKGADTVIASPDGRTAINENAPPWLATAGSGDGLAGFVAGLLAQGMPVFEAACAAVWLHGECANVFGPGLIAEDLAEVLPQVLRRLHG